MWIIWRPARCKVKVQLGHVSTNLISTFYDIVSAMFWKIITDEYGQHWFLGANFHNGNYVHSSVSGGNEEEQRLGYEFLLDSWQINYNPGQKF